jgi:hypothetical protein
MSPLAWLVGILLFTTVWYRVMEVRPSLMESLYYSVVTLTTAPPGPMPGNGGLTTWIATIETFVGTFLTVLLGYVLGNREQF